MADRTYVIRLQGDATDLGRSAESAAASVGQLSGAVDGFARQQGTVAAATGRTAQALATGNRQMAAFSATGKLTADQMRQLSFQTNDFFVQVASGQSPLTALIQQGSQLSGTFGGVGGALRAVGSLFTVANVAIGASVAAVGALGYAYIQATDRQRDFNRYLVLTGNSAGVTAVQVNAMADRIAASTNVSLSSARELVVAYADTGKVGPAALESVARATARLAQLSGKDAADVRKEFDGLFDKPAASAIKLNEQHGFLTATTAKLIVELQKQGKTEEAGKLVSDELNRVLAERNKTMGVQIGLWERLKVAASDAFTNLSRSFDAPTTQDQTKAVVERIQAMRAALANSEARGDNEAVITRRRAALDSLTKQYHALFEVQKSEGVAATKAAADAAKATVEREKVTKILGDATKKDKAPKKEKADFFNDAQDKLEAQIRERLDKIADSEEKARDQALAKDIEAYKRRSDAGLQYGQQLADQTEALQIGLIQDQQARGLAQIAAEKAQMTARLDALHLEADEYSRVWEGIQSFVAARNAQLTEELKPEWQKQLEAWRDTNRLMRDSFNEFQSGWLREGEQAWVEFAKTGKLNTKSLVDFAIAELARLTFRQNIAGGFSQLGQAFAAYFTGGTNYSGVTSGGGGFAAPSGTAPLANGGALAGGQLQAFAQGGVLGPNGGLLTRPTLFPMKNGMGLAGEAGTEAVMPLSRTASGKLGVIAQGGGTPVVNNIQIIGAPSTPQVRRKSNLTGGIDTQLIFEQFRDRLIDDVQNGGKFSAAQQSQYGVNRAQGLVR